MKKINLLIITCLILVSCSSFKDAGKVLRNEKIKTTDEFLVKKRNPLVLPPNFENIPEPGTLNNNEENQKDKIKKMLKAPIDENVRKNKPSSVENSIINRIRK
jgi:hypothetical protein